MLCPSWGLRGLATAYLFKCGMCSRSRFIKEPICFTTKFQNNSISSEEDSVSQNDIQARVWIVYCRVWLTWTRSLWEGLTDNNLSFYFFRNLAQVPGLYKRFCSIMELIQVQQRRQLEGTQRQTRLREGTFFSSFRSDCQLLIVKKGNRARLGMGSDRRL